MKPTPQPRSQATGATGWSALREELRREPPIDLHYLGSAEARHHAVGAMLVAALCFLVSYLLGA